MTNEHVNLLLAIFGFALVWTTSVIAGMIWLTSKFRDMEGLIYRLVNRIERRVTTLEHRPNGRYQKPKADDTLTP